ncbi:MAG: hypothetical protein GY789_01735 [Hyphomicrobiales bacterium]|nr:hypothetical protein [Hyphomicrobiales bacterium]
MSRNAGTLETLALLLAEAFAPLTDELQPARIGPFLRSLGLALQTGDTSTGAIAAAGGTAAMRVDELTATIAPLATALDALDTDDLATVPPVISAGAETVAKLVASIDALKDFVTAVDGVIATLPEDARIVAEAVADNLALRIVEVIILGHLDRRAKDIAKFLPLLGIVEDVQEPGDGTGAQPPFRFRRLHLDRIGELLTDPQTYFQAIFGFGAPDFDGLAFFRPVEKLLKDNDLPVLLLQPPGAPPVLEAFLLRLEAEESISPPGLRAELRVPGTQSFDQTTRLSDVWNFIASADMTFSAGLAMILSYDGSLSLEPGSAGGTVNGTASAGFRAESGGGDPITLLGVTGATRLTVDSFEAMGGISANFDTVSGAAQVEPVITAGFEQLTAHLDFGGGDSFLNSISGGGSGSTDVSLGASWSPSQGVKFSGSSALEITVPAHVQVGPATLENVFLVAGLDFEGDAPEVPVEISAGIKGELGPLVATVERVGLKLTFTVPPEGGNLGPLNVEAGFKPPNGIGLAVDGGGMSGGGYLFLDPDRGEYAGALELKFQGAIHLKAIGVLNTILPDGSDGFSLMILITAEFTPIQLGFGFTLNGVGGLIGINRTMMLDVLGDGVRDGTLQSILFPDDVVANAASIIADLQSVFPPMEGRFVVGPMAKLGWGTPTLVTLELGVLIEIPRPAFAIIGILSMALPDESVAILEINVAFAGSVDFEKKQLRFDASIFDSRVLTFQLSGDMALRIYWGENANFLMTVGGFHPAYVPPPMDLPDIRRIAISLMTGNPRISAEAYFAVTSNTVQFGGRVEAYAGADIFNVYGHLSLDALIQFNPFHFIVSLGAMVAARSGSTVLFSVELTFTLEGPTPWHAYGKAKFSISLLFFDIDVSIKFDVKVGAEEDTTLPPVDALDELAAALGNVENWAALAAADEALLVSLRDIGNAARQVVHPMGGLTVMQKAVPLNIEIDKFGSRNLAGGNRIEIAAIRVGGDQIETTPLRGEFAPAQFFNLSNAEQLSNSSFDDFDTGAVATSAGQAKAVFQRRIPIAHELAYIDKPELRLEHILSTDLIATHLANSAVANSPLAKGPRVATGLGTPKVKVAKSGYALADVDTLQDAAGAARYESAAEAERAVRRMEAENPGRSGRLQVVADYELAA